MSHAWVAKCVPRSRVASRRSRVGSSSEFLHRSMAYACALMYRGCRGSLATNQLRCRMIARGNNPDARPFAALGLALARMPTRISISGISDGITALVVFFFRLRRITERSELDQSLTQTACRIHKSESHRLIISGSPRDSREPSSRGSIGR